MDAESIAVRALATRLGISEAVVRRERAAGKSFAEIARAHGMSRGEAVAVVAKALAEAYPPRPGVSGMSLAGLAQVIVDAGDDRADDSDRLRGEVSPALVAQWLTPRSRARRGAWED